MNSPAPLPQVILSWAQSADGRIATRTGDSKYLSSPESLEIQQELRRDCDAVLVGIGTVLADDPRLLCRLGPDKNPKGHQPLRVVLDSRFQTPIHSQLAATALESPVLVIGAPIEEALSDRVQIHKRRSVLEEQGIHIITVPLAPATGKSYPKLDLGAVLQVLRQKGVETLFVEGGAGILTAFLADNLADRIILDISPLFIGEGISAVGDLGTERLSDTRGFKTLALEQRGTNVVWTMERGGK